MHRTIGYIFAGLSLFRTQARILAKFLSNDNKCRMLLLLLQIILVLSSCDNLSK